MGRAMAKDLGVKLNQAIGAKGLTTNQAAEAAGVERSDVLEWFSGAARPTPTQLQDLCFALGVDISEFYEPAPQETYRTSVTSSKPFPMRDYLAEQDRQRDALPQEMTTLKDWLDVNAQKPGELMQTQGR